MAVQALSTFLKITDQNGTVQGRYQNSLKNLTISLDGADYAFLNFIYSGASKNRTGDNLEAGLVLASNVLSMNITTQAVTNRWNIEVISCSMNPETWVIGRTLTREFWVVASYTYDPVQIEVLLSSGIDAVGATAPTRTLTSKRVGSLPTTGAISNV
jgi:hypothetical protein